ncbi:MULTISPECIES: lipopolysaccharide biosynthesis protein [Sanguibacteroides]|uniref:Polysaccharide biosynthesis protein n=1 Tax=Sanguibacteroides justesenii TaxID=1547597 RepID=A0A0C3RIZ6_9PORP|nr:MULTISPECIES: oligosaccharide flippase family protein [Sanguibacteroides]KIO46064.1 polysaccharide biosynthesis protein [Sanguibacteroides justesenii]KIO47439.1 polysaccharide biosynthesis protein [Sanguibacteroides justesenii]PXZ42912.1 polysaccharide biosynthesis protein [Sanguibacteroides justesenii]
MTGIKSLAKDTAIYGMSSIIGRFLNWCLVPLYTYKLATGEFGDVTNLYAWMALLLVILIYGLETGFFRFANDGAERDPKTVYSTCLFSLATTSAIFMGLVFLFQSPISRLLKLSEHPEYILITAAIIAMDAFCALPFAYLRYLKRPIRFAALKLLFIALNIILNLFFLVVCPWIWKHAPEWINWFYDPTYGVGYILISNLLGTFIVLLALAPEIVRIPWRFRPDLLKRILRYSFPLLILGVAGIMNQTLDKILYPMLISDPVAAKSGLGIYGANYKIAIVMVMFTQAFRYAYEPFIFAQNKGEDKRVAYAEAMKYFIIFGLFIFLGVMFYLEILRYFIDPDYFSGLQVVPIVMIAELFFGIFFNLSLWYKLTDKTQWGAYFSLFGLAITLTINIAFVPRYGYIACAWAAFTCYFAMMIASWFIGQHYYPIRYDLKGIGKYLLLALVLYVIALWIPIENQILRLSFRTILLVLYILYVIKKDLPLKQIPYLNRWAKK